MNITVIGHLCFDTIHHPGDRGTTRSFGGIVYSLAALAALTSHDDAITPVVGVSEEDFGRFGEWLGRFPQMRTDGIFTFPGPTNDVHLYYGDTGNSRIECSKHISRPIPFSAIRPFLAADGIMVNMVSGFDITLETLDYIRMEIREKSIPMAFDFHSLTLGIDGEFRRFRRPLSDWRRWCFMMDTVQLSEDEAAGLTPERYGEEDLASQLLSLMAVNLIITRGNRGATLFHQDRKKVTRTDVPGLPLTPTPDPTGCGDVFGAAYFVRYLETRSSVSAVETANTVAAFHTTYSGTEGLAGAPRFLKEHYPVSS